MRSLCLLGTAALLAAANIQAAGYYLTVGGLGGDPDYEKQFQTWAADLDKALQANGPNTHTAVLSGAAATRERIEQELKQIAAGASEDDSLALFLIGHGTFDGTDYKFNVPGPDIAAAELAATLNTIHARQQLVVVMTSASGSAVATLAKKDRIVITATKSGNEKNAVIFTRYWIDSLRDPSADTNKDGKISALESFRYADRKTAEYFESQKLLATEHALLADSGATAGVRNPASANGQGLLAAAFPVIRPPAESASALSPGKQKLLVKKEDLEAKIDKLKYEKPAMAADDYKRQLSTLLLELAKTQAELDKPSAESDQ
jgi:Peptidase C13 family